MRDQDHDDAKGGVSWGTVLISVLFAGIVVYVSQRFWFGCSDIFGTCIAIKKPF